MSFIDKFKKFMTRNDYQSRYIIPPSGKLGKYLADCGSQSDSCSVDVACPAANEPCYTDYCNDCNDCADCSDCYDCAEDCTNDCELSSCATDGAPTPCPGDVFNCPTDSAA